MTGHGFSPFERIQGEVRPCTSCQGQGRIKRQKTLEVKIHAGIDDGMRIRSAGNGEPGMNGRPPGDLYIEIRLRKHDIFERLALLGAPLMGVVECELQFDLLAQNLRLQVAGDLNAGEGNLVVRAARVFEAMARVTINVRIHLRKPIPVAAGLGGGSADAAATLIRLKPTLFRGDGQPGPGAYGGSNWCRRREAHLIDSH